MQAVSFYIVYPLIYLIAMLPFSLLYRLSDLLYFFLRLSGYRRKVVYDNLKNSFPEKTEQEIQHLCNEFFKYLCDLILETLKTLRMTARESKERCVFHTPQWLDTMYGQKQSFIIVMGHYGNWEWAGPSFTLNTPYQLTVIYRPLTNLYFDKMMIRMRTRFGTQITPVNQTLRHMVAHRNSTSATAFIADQAASTANSYWTTFLHQDTAVFNGPEKLAVKFNYPVVYINIQRVKRGYYSVTPELLFTNPAETKENEILETFTKRLEKDIIHDPAIWLWSHRRWKHTRPASL
ncbi:MAG: lysophospholipid acyltransferase family protein [Bacteroidetes bacterium]|nr:lysophospholipid acyltransferase family protein [Bacteroidota bacterium]